MINPPIERPDSPVRVSCCGRPVPCGTCLALCALCTMLVTLTLTGAGPSSPAELQSSSNSAPPAAKPHIVFMLVDDLGWADVSYRRDPEDATNITTPVFEALLSEGVRLERAYAYSWCGPSRSSLLSGRLPVHVMMNYTNANAVDWSHPLSSASGIPAGMTTIGSKMRTAGYATAYTGKWGVGYAWGAQMPRQRGFDHYLGYLQDSVDYYTGERNPEAVNTPGGCEVAGYIHPYLVDFWQDDGPAAQLLDGQTWMDSLLVEESLRLIRAHDAARPFFLVHAFHSVHTPLRPPAALEAAYAHVTDPTRRAYAAMVSWVDASVGRMVGALQAKGMWERTLLVMSSDNGGPTYPGPSPALFGGANNRPLKGSKTVEFEGGIRVNAFVSGGALPPAARGRVLDDFIHIADWYATFCALAGVDPADASAAAAGLPPVDSKNLWPWLSGQWAAPARGEAHAGRAAAAAAAAASSPSSSSSSSSAAAAVPVAAAASAPIHEVLQINAYVLIEPATGWKLITGADQDNIRRPFHNELLTFNFYLRGYGSDARRMARLWQSGVDERAWPADLASLDCSRGCLFNVLDDPSERDEVGDRFPEVRRRLRARLARLNAALFDPYRGNESEADAVACRVLADNGGFYGPWTDVDSWVWPA